MINALFRNINKTKRIPSENIHLTKTHPLHNLLLKTGYDYICHYNVMSQFKKIKKQKVNCMVFISHCCDSRLGLKISTHIILHFPQGHIHLNRCPHCFPLRFCTGPGHFSPPHLYKFAPSLAAVGMGPHSREFQLQCKLNHVQFFIRRRDGNVRKIQFLCIQAYRLMHPAVIG